MFPTKKKKYQFSVDFFLDELASVPFITNHLFAKIRLLDERSSANFTTKREEVKANCVKWGTRFGFNCKMTANASTAVLDSKLLRVSVRKEAKGGRSFQKLGFRDIDLAKFAGSGPATQKLLLEGYDAKHRQDNSTIQVTIDVNLVTGDPLFKRPSFDCQSPPKSVFYDYPNNGGTLQRMTTHDNNRATDGPGNDGPSAISSFPLADDSMLILNKEPTPETRPRGAGAKVPRNESNPTFTIPNGVCGHHVRTVNTMPAPASTSTDVFGTSQSRNPSTNSQQSKPGSAGYGSLPSHSRQGSADSGHKRISSTGSGVSDLSKYGSTERKQRVQNSVLHHDLDGKLDKSRPAPEDVIKDLVGDLRENEIGREEGHELGLYLYLEKDGTTTLGSRTAKHNHGPGKGVRTAMATKKTATVSREDSKGSSTNGGSVHSSMEHENGASSSIAVVRL